MKKIEAIIKPFKLEEVKDALADIGVAGMTATEVKGYGRQRVVTGGRRVGEFRADFSAKTKIEIVVDDAKFAEVLCAIMMAARTGNLSDGKIFVFPVDEVVRIRTNERTAVAV